MDNLSPKQRSKCMSHIRSKWTAQESKIHNLLKGNKIKHKMHPNIMGSPDLIILKEKKAVFLNGCFWHKCSKCYVEPKSRRDYWLPKIKRNVQRDKINKIHLKQQGFSVISIWEHEIKNYLHNVLQELVQR